MSAAEIVERFGLEDYHAQLVLIDAENAITCLRWAAEWQQSADDINPDIDQRRIDKYMKYAKQRRAEARFMGHEIRDVIHYALRTETTLSWIDTTTAGWELIEVSCAGETCSSCERPMWHHVRSKLGTVLCPTTRRYWRILRAIVARDAYSPGRGDESIIREIAKR